MRGHKTPKWVSVRKELGLSRPAKMKEARDEAFNLPIASTVLIGKIETSNGYDIPKVR